MSLVLFLKEEKGRNSETRIGRKTEARETGKGKDRTRKEKNGNAGKTEKRERKTSA